MRARLVLLAWWAVGGLACDASADEDLPLGLVAVEHPAANPYSEAKHLLGKELFFDKNLSHDGTISCATCHNPDEAFAQRGVAISEGVGGRVGRRNSPSLLNVAFSKSLFFDGRSETLEDQAWEPILAEDEMANTSVEEVLERLGGSEKYRELFQGAFEDAEPNEENVAKALACFQRTLLSGNSAFDRWNAGEPALSEEAEEGYRLFIGRAQCWQCHPLNSEESLLMTDHSFHRTDVSGQEEPDGELRDLGRFEVTEEPIDRLLFKTPSLRNVALTPPYMHDGSIATLKEVVQFYNRAEGGGELLPLNLSDEQLDALVAFLEAFTGES